MHPQEKPSLPVHALAERHPGLTPAVAASYLEAARVSLDRYHSPAVEFIIICPDGRSVAEAEWEPCDERTRRAWANQDDATEAGAYACVLAALELRHGFVAVRRAETRTGADYYVAKPGEGVEDLEGCYRLEISGVGAGTTQAVAQRVNKKVAQARAGASNLPAIAGVVGFEACHVEFQAVGEP